MPATIYFYDITLQKGKKKKLSYQNGVKERHIQHESSSQGNLKVNPACCCKKACHLDPSLLQR